MMIILIAESKTMGVAEESVSSAEYAAHRPVGENVADEVMRLVASMPLEAVAQSIKVSQAMAAKILQMAYEFPNKSLGLKAIEAFTGVVFKSFDYFSLTESEKNETQGRVRVISSLYGWLRPDDIVKPYRFDFTTRLAPDDRTFSEYWRKDVTIQLVKSIQDGGFTDILSLLPGDASKCIDWKLVKRFAKVWKVDFKELKDGGEWKTPNAGRLKTLRGELLRTIIREGLSSSSELLALSTDNMMPLGTPEFPDHISFCV